MWRVFAFYLLSGASMFAADELRTFTSTDGQQIEATVVNYNPADGTVVIRRSEGRKFTVPYDRFSPEDQAYLDAWREEYDRSFSKVEIFGIKQNTSRVLFLVGISSPDYWHQFKPKMKRTIEDMRAPTDFNLATTVGATLFDELQPINEQTKFRANRWLENHKFSMSLNPSEIYDAVSNEKLESLYLITDKTITSSVVLNVRKLQKQRDVPIVIHTIQMEESFGSYHAMRDLAKENGGTYLVN